ncbi:ankycorbin-like isoform X2 [Hydractinia symbiolongicarpus]|uniref:ankycorbin-like isoform X2 n=1 Tax=Hydractinia symbiolongicarpus TaxID=13093 RepID=UPI0025511655|nr:ankycorbin-like isoform X2 [Hydractinia symbiolongicarpus]
MLQRGILRLSKRKKKNEYISDENVSIQDEWSKYDERLLDCVAREDIPKLKETLKKKGVSPIKLSRDGQTAMHKAVKKSMIAAIECMLMEQPDLSTTDIQGRTVYHIAAINGDTIVLKKLLDFSRWNLEIKDACDMTALHYAVRSGETACVKLLIDNNCPANAQDGEGRTSLLMSLLEGHDKIAVTLILHGVDVNICDNKNRSCLMIACAQGMCQVAALLLSKGAETEVQDKTGKTVLQIAQEAGQTDIVNILQNGRDELEISGDSGMVNTEDVEDNIEKDEHEENDDIAPIEKRMTRNSSSSSTKRNSALRHDDNSLTTSIIESLMGFDVGSDTISEVSATEDQLHMKIEDERKELEIKLSKQNRRVEELESEMTSVRNKLKWETELRFAAEKEVLELKSQIELLQESRTRSSHNDELKVTFGSDEYLSGDNTVKDNGGDANHDDDRDGDDNNNGDADDIDNGDFDQKDGEIKNEQPEEEETNSDCESYGQQGAHSDSDESVSKETGYRKKSLGTAKQHIDMLEEHILSLEEDLLNKDNEICGLETKLKNTKELVDLNNNTTVSLEVYNQLRADNKNERNSFKEEIKTLENKISKLEEADRQMKEKKVALETRLQSEENMSKELNEKMLIMQIEMNNLKKELEECQISYEQTIECYRANMVALHQDSLDATLKEVLVRIVRLRSG